MHRQSREAQGFGRADSGHGSVMQGSTPAVAVTAVTKAGTQGTAAAVTVGGGRDAGTQGL